MKKLIFTLVSFISALALTFASAPVTSVKAQSDMAHRLVGRIVLQTEEEGEAWYIYPGDYKRYYLGRPRDAWNIMRALGLGATDANLARVPINGTEWGIASDMIKYVNGRILIQVELNGEAWYVSPVNLKRYYMGRPADAFQLMRNLGLGISNSDLSQIEEGTIVIDDDSDGDDSDGDNGDGDDGSSDDGSIPTNLVQPSDLEYLGAFRLPSGPDGDEGARGWGWSGRAATYYPSGDPSGASDGYPGSIYATGHEQHVYVSEFNIPRPVISSGKNVNDLNTATNLQGFYNILDADSYELPRIGLAYLPQQGSMSSDKIAFSRGEHNQEGSVASHGWFNLNLANPNTAQTWYIGDELAYSVNDYMFTIPSNWANSNVSGRLLATGRYRDGGMSGQGPSLFAIAPWSQGNPPSNGTRLNATTLLKYDTSYDRDALYDDSARTMNGYHHSDEWSGAAWLTKNNKAAVAFVGTKGVGNYWYGDSNGPCTECAGERGWWSTTFEGRIIFYDPADLASVAAGSMESHEPQPYAYLNIDRYLYNINSTQQWYHTGAVTFDRTRGYLYVVQYAADTDNYRALVHVFNIN